MEQSDIEVLHFSAQPVTSPLDSEVLLQLQFRTPRHLIHCEWNVHVPPKQYVVDTIHRRKEVPLLHLSVPEYPPGAHALDLRVPRMDLEGLKLKKSHILTTGLLVCKERNRSGAARLHRSRLRYSHDDTSARVRRRIRQNHHQPARTRRLTLRCLLNHEVERVQNEGSDAFLVAFKQASKEFF
jgi:hypothetical protein